MNQANPAQRRRFPAVHHRIRVASTCLAVATLLFAVGCGSEGTSEEEQTLVPGTTAERRSVAPPMTVPERPPRGFVGSAVCAECHEDIAAEYSRNAMARSLNAVKPSGTDEKIIAEFSTVNGVSYSVE